MPRRLNSHPPRNAPSTPTTTSPTTPKPEPFMILPARNPAINPTTRNQISWLPVMTPPEKRFAGLI
jgi:hypothetical protein